MHTLRRELRLSRPPDEVFAFFADAHNLEAITPPWLRFRVVTPGPIRLGAGALIEYRLRLHRIPIRWLTRSRSGSRAGASSTSRSAGPTATGSTRTSSSPTPAEGPWCATRCRSARSDRITAQLRRREQSFLSVLKRAV
jgi:hypothetical protein